MLITILFLGDEVHLDDGAVLAAFEPCGEAPIVAVFVTPSNRTLHIQLIEEESLDFFSLFGVVVLHLIEAALEVLQTLAGEQAIRVDIEKTEAIV